MSKQLDRYRTKRDFTITSEPKGDAPVADSKRMRFVIQKHDATRLHYDLRLEVGGVFKSWAVTKGPSLNPADKRLAVEVEDHPLDYGDFEGTIPKGEYGGGTVMLWDRGYYESTSAKRGLKDGKFEFFLDGKKLQGGFVLARMRRRDGERRDNWLLIKRRDDSASETVDILTVDRSVASGRTLDQIAAGIGRKPVPFITAKRDRSVISKTKGGNRPAKKKSRQREAL
jgi:bifunctional non-homologous end joining protein LigD